MKNAVCYVRVSTMEQAQHGVSLDAQVERLMSYSTAMGLNVVAVIREEGVSAGKQLAKRPGGKEVLTLLKSRQATHVVALKLDRLFRSTEDALKLTTEWDANGVALHLVDMGGTNINTQTSMGKIMMTLLAAFAEFERTLISERTSAALSHKKSKKQVYGHLPYGYSRNGNNLVPNEQEQKILKRIFEWRNEKRSLYDIACQLNDLGVPSKKGGTWHAATIAHIVNNDLYREFPNNLIPWQKPEKKDTAEEQFVGQLAGVVEDLGKDTNTL